MPASLLPPFGCGLPRQLREPLASCSKASAIISPSFQPFQRARQSTSWRPPPHERAGSVQMIRCPPTSSISLEDTKGHRLTACAHSQLLFCPGRRCVSSATNVSSGGCAMGCGDPSFPPVPARGETSGRDWSLVERSSLRGRSVDFASGFSMSMVVCGWFSRFMNDFRVGRH